MCELKIIIPSRKRAESVLTECDNAILLVDEKEFEEYKKFNNLEIHTHPSLNNLAQIRQFALQKYKNVFFIDDDIVSIERTYQTTGKLNGKEVYELIIKTADQAKELGASLFGFNNDPSPTHYNQHKPFMLNGYINGCAFGILENSGLYFNKKTTACESHWINLLNAYKNRFCFIDKRYHFRQKTNSTFKLEGGQCGKRTLSSEKLDTLILRRAFGESVVLKKEQNKTKQQHEYQRQLNIRL
jgi:hypothetical protein